MNHKEDSKGKLEGIVRDYLREHPNLGGTVHEIAAATGISEWSISPRMAPLRRKRLIHDSGTKRGKCIVWKIGQGDK